MWSASVPLLAHNSSSQGNDFRKRYFTWKQKCFVLLQLQRYDCTWGLILYLLSQGRVPVKLTEPNFGIRIYMDWVKNSHSCQEPRQRGLLKMRFCCDSVHFKIAAISRRYVGSCSACDTIVEKTVTAKATKWRVSCSRKVGFFRKIMALNKFSRNIYRTNAKPHRT